MGVFRRIARTKCQLFFPYIFVLVLMLVLLFQHVGYQKKRLKKQMLQLKLTDRNDPSQISSKKIKFTIEESVHQETNHIEKEHEESDDLQKSSNTGQKFPNAEKRLPITEKRKLAKEKKSPTTEKKKSVNSKKQSTKKEKPTNVKEKSTAGDGKLITNKAKSLNKKLILIYSTLFGLKQWPTLNLEESKTFMNRCEYKMCDITYDKSMVSSADALLFHGVDVLNEKEFSADILRNVSKQKKSGQKWVFFIQESPDNYNGFAKYHGLFNWLMSYKYTSDINVPYGHYKKLDSSDSIPSATVNYAKGRNKLAVWFVSNCPGHPRENFIKELKKYMPITVGGKCAQRLFNESVSCEHGSDSCLKLIKSHKFFFAFENSFCDYYVSEKYWSQIDRGMVPVVMGARYDKTNVIPGSYIDASKFSSIKDLAKHLLYLHSNDTAYNEYFSWKQKYKRIGLEKMCELCKSLHVNKLNRAYKNIWSTEKDCVPFQWKKDRMKKLAEESRKSRAKSSKKS